MVIGELEIQQQVAWIRFHDPGARLDLGLVAQNHRGEFRRCIYELTLSHTSCTSARVLDIHLTNMRAETLIDMNISHAQ
ncbi:hypothetical protein RSAG8_13502, partial [Rhizoctonia solani AG-8 WAC10335]